MYVKLISAVRFRGIRRRRLRLYSFIGGIALLLAVIAPSTASATGGAADSVQRAGSPLSDDLVKSGVAAANGKADKNDPARHRALPPNSAFWILQMNLCNSGHAGCYEGGQAIPEAAGVIQDWIPDVVTLNEICLPDVENTLFPTMLQTWSSGWVFYAFMPAWDAAADAPIQCTGGRGEYGNAIIGHVLDQEWQGVEAFGDIHYWQGVGENELRSWVCAYAIGSYYGCATHLVAGNGTAAMAQCQYLMDTVIPGIWDYEGVYWPSVMGGDLNLHYQGSPNVQDCVPSGWYRKGDGDVQHIMATNDLAFGFSEEIGMDHTDHPAWLIATTAS